MIQMPMGQGSKNLQEEDQGLLFMQMKSLPYCPKLLELPFIRRYESENKRKS
jgi:hypothetical protein